MLQHDGAGPGAAEDDRGRDRMHGDGTDADVPLIDDVPRAFCKNHCLAWTARKLRNKQDASYCARIVWPPDEDGKRRCRWEWKRIKERMSLCAKLKKS